MERPDPTEYYFQVVKAGEEPQWPRPEDELVVGSQPLSSGFTQFWAYPKDQGKDAEDKPHAEVIAAEHRTEQPAILIDQYGPSDDLELVLVKDGHAWGKAETSIRNLEDNISSLLEFSRDKFNMGIEHFMTTTRVSKEIEDKLDDLEEAVEDSSDRGTSESEDKEISKSEEVDAVDTADVLETDSPEPKTAFPDEVVPQDEPKAPSQTEDFSNMRIRPVTGGGNYRGSLQSNIYASDRSSGGKSTLTWVIPVLLILIVFGGALYFKDKILAQIGGGSSAPVVEVTPTPIPEPTPTPTPEIDRSQYKIRVLNGTTTTGAAGTLAGTLETKGWGILSKGNAKDQATAQTTVRVKEGLEAVAEALISDLAPDLEASTGANLTASDKADAEVVIGKK